MVALIGSDSSVEEHTCRNSESVSSAGSVGALLSPARGSPVVSTLPGGGLCASNAPVQQPLNGNERAWNFWHQLQVQKLERLKRSETLARSCERKEFAEMHRRFWENKKSKADARESQAGSSRSVALASGSASLSSRQPMTLPQAANQPSPIFDPPLEAVGVSSNTSTSRFQLQPIASQAPCIASKRKPSSAASSNFGVHKAPKFHYQQPVPLNRQMKNTRGHSGHARSLAINQDQVESQLVNNSFFAPTVASSLTNSSDPLIRQSNNFFTTVVTERSLTADIQASCALTFNAAAKISNPKALNQQPPCSNTQMGQSTRENQLLNLPDDISDELLTRLISSPCQFLDDASTNAALDDLFGATESSVSNQNATFIANATTASVGMRQQQEPPTNCLFASGLRADSMRFLSAPEQLKSNHFTFDQSIKVEPHSPPTCVNPTSTSSPYIRWDRFVNGHSVNGAFPYSRVMPCSVIDGLHNSPPRLLPERPLSNWIAETSDHTFNAESYVQGPPCISQPEYQLCLSSASQGHQEMPYAQHACLYNAFVPGCTSTSTLSNFPNISSVRGQYSCSNQSPYANQQLNGLISSGACLQQQSRLNMP